MSTSEAGGGRRGVDKVGGFAECVGVELMSQPARKKKLSYPEETPGSRMAAEIRRRANKLTSAERREHFQGAMAMIYGGERAIKTTGSGH